MKAPSYAILDGIIAATSLYLAAPPDNESDLAIVLEADEWARTVREEKREKAERRIAGLPPASHKPASVTPDRPPPGLSRLLK